jgi:preprotein translocase subunit SecD
MKELKYRFSIIIVALLASVYALWPRDTVVRVQAPTGDGFVYDTVKQIPVRLGLDIKGGMYIALEPDESEGVVTDVSDLMDRAVTVVRTRIDGLGIAETNVQREGSRRIIVEIPGIQDPIRAQEIAGTTARLEFKIVDETAELDRALPRMDAVLRAKGITSGDTKQQPSVKAPDILKLGGKSDSTPAVDSGGVLQSKIMRNPADPPGFYVVAADQFRPVEALLALPEVKAVLRPGKQLVWGADSVEDAQQGWVRYLYVVDSRPVLEGNDLVSARPYQDPSEGVKVFFEVNNSGGRRFEKSTQEHMYDYMAIILDNRAMGTPPRINGVISTRGEISMPGKPIAEANDLALVLRAGALPLALKIEEVRSIGASLGQDAIDQGIRAGVLGLALVVVIMITYYRFSGFLAIVGLVFYSITTLGMLAALGAVLTLPGVAGFVLSIGMAVDANFLIFERIREELIRGKTVRTAIGEGFNHAWSAIVDTHVTTALTAAILYQFGTGPVRGFAVTLLAGIASSLVSAIFVVRSLFLLWLSRSQKAQTLSI